MGSTDIMSTSVEVVEPKQLEYVYNRVDQLHILDKNK